MDQKGRHGNVHFETQCKYAVEASSHWGMWLCRGDGQKLRGRLVRVCVCVRVSGPLLKRDDKKNCPFKAFLVHIWHF